MLKVTQKYDDIITLPCPTSTKYPRMSVSNRAAQFAPFAALTGYYTAIHETERLTEEEKELDEYVFDGLEQIVQQMKENIMKQPKVKIVYFQPDEQKEGGAYLTYIGKVCKIKEQEQSFVMEDGLEIKMDKVCSMEMIEISSCILGNHLV